jgi:SnoaL-like protein
MSKTVVLTAAAIATGLLLSGTATAQQKSAAAPTLTDQDRADMQGLVNRYAVALGTCAAEEYADLFAAPDGSFASGPRGHIAGRDKLIALVKSERHCNDKSVRRPTNGPTAVVEAAPGGAVGKTISGSGGGHYEDTYVKTAHGWRFKSRSFISAQEEKANLTSQDFIEIRRLAGNDLGRYEDVYSSGPDGKQLRSSGVVIAPSADGATGKVFLRNDGGHYEDVYMKGAAGWRFKSRTYVAPTEAASTTASAR